MRCHSFTSISSGWLDTLVGDPKMVFEASYSQIHEALRALMKRAIKSGDIRQSVSPMSRPALNGSKARGDWSRFSSWVRGH
jgi:hypothetical protein